METSKLLTSKMRKKIMKLGREAYSENPCQSSDFLNIYHCVFMLFFRQAVVYCLGSCLLVNLPKNSETERRVMIQHTTLHIRMAPYM